MKFSIFNISFDLQVNSVSFLFPVHYNTYSLCFYFIFLFSLSPSISLSLSICWNFQAEKILKAGYNFTVSELFAFRNQCICFQKKLTLNEKKNRYKFIRPTQNK